MRAIRWSAQRFRDFVAGFYLTEAENERDLTFEHAGDYLYAWLLFGEGTKACGYDFATYASAAVLIAQECVRPEYFDYYPLPSMGAPEFPQEEISRSVSQIIDYECRLCQLVLDPHFFKLTAADPDLYGDGITRYR
jgi:hypothetical protein